jgi:heptosyltransferase-2
MTPKILIIRMSSIGDILLTTPLIRILKNTFPDGRVDFIVKKQYQDLIRYHPSLSRIYTYDARNENETLKKLRAQIREERYDIIADIHKNFRSIYLSQCTGAGQIVRFRKHAWKRWLLVKTKLNLYKDIEPVHRRYIHSFKSHRLKDDGQGLEITIPDEVTERVSRLWESRSDGRLNSLIGIAPGASYFTKRWTTEGFAAVINRIRERINAGVILFGDSHDQAVTRELIASCGKDRLYDFAGELSLLETAAMMRKCQLVVTNDSGLMHLATALKKKVVAIFGSTTEELGFFPVSEHAVVIENRAVPCRPCSHVGRHTCPKKHFDCMSQISPDQVMRGINQLMTDTVT